VIVLKLPSCIVNTSVVVIGKITALLGHRGIYPTPIILFIGLFVFEMWTVIWSEIKFLTSTGRGRVEMFYNVKYIDFPNAFMMILHLLFIYLFSCSQTSCEDHTASFPVGADVKNE
jgi:hypothetical protein